MKVQEVSQEICDNTERADPAELRDYDARKRSVAFRSSLLLAGVAILVALRSPLLGLDLAVGGGCGVVNMLLIMRNNERLLAGRRSRGVYGLSNVVRILGIGALPAVAGVTGPPWALAISYAGFFTPLASYAIELRNAYRRGT
ncbi:MAG: hypothetical protein JO036_10850 [Candidatus Eremiobacteraeota bacterium]|nr:hypothetical protein [Candidatus Eremiobacteraeota bacterium]